MKVRLVGALINNDLKYDVQAFIQEKWVTIRCFGARDRQEAIDFMNDIARINTNKYDTCKKFPNTILMESE
jgi:hypothetical protein